MSLRVCHLVHHLALGGLETQLLRIIEETPDDEVAYTVSYFGEDASLRDDYEAAGTQVVELDPLLSKPLSQVSLPQVRPLVSLLRQGEFDVVHVHGSLSLHAVGRICGQFAGVPVVGTYHNPREDFYSVAQGMERLTRSLSAVNIAVSEDVERSYAGSAQRYDPDDADLTRRTYTIHNGIDVEGFRLKVDEADGAALRAEHDLAESLVFLTVGRYTEQKNQGNLVRAMATLVTDCPDAHLFVVGWGPLEEDLRQIAAEHGVADAVTITGRVDSVHEYYSMADVFVLPSLTEGLSVVLLEAMSAGLPVVGTDAPGTEEAVAPGTTGLITHSGSSAGLASAMSRLSDDDRRQRMGQNGYERARSEFSLRRTVQSYLDVYRRVGESRLSVRTPLQGEH